MWTLQLRSPTFLNRDLKPSPSSSPRSCTREQRAFVFPAFQVRACFCWQLASAEQLFMFRGQRRGPRCSGCFLADVLFLVLPPLWREGRGRGLLRPEGPALMFLLQRSGHQSPPHPSGSSLNDGTRSWSPGMVPTLAWSPAGGRPDGVLGDQTPPRIKPKPPSNLRIQAQNTHLYSFRTHPRRAGGVRDGRRDEAAAS